MKVNFIGSVMKIIVCTPNRNSDISIYQNEVLPLVSKITELRDSLKSSGDNLSSEEIQNILDYLNKIMRLKKVDEQEQQRRINTLLAYYPFIKNTKLFVDV